MKYSGLYFISNPSTNLDTSLNIVNELVQVIETNFDHITRQGPWSLSYRAFRDTIPPGYQPAPGADGKPTPFAHTYQHMLNHTSIAQHRTYIHVQPPSAEGSVVSIPRAQQDAHASVTRHQMAALWTARHVLSVQQGVTYDSSILSIQVGELRASREGPQSSAVNSPGVVVCIRTVVGSEYSEDSYSQPETTNGNVISDDEQVDFDFAQAIIRDCWRKIKGDREFSGRRDAREFLMAPKLATTREQEREAAVRVWCEVLRMRG